MQIQLLVIVFLRTEGTNVPVLRPDNSIGPKCQMDIVVSTSIFEPVYIVTR